MAQPPKAPTPPAHTRPAPASKRSAVSPKLLRYIKSVENPQRVGWNSKRGRWYPHKDPSGGYNIGYGHHLQSDAEYKSLLKTGMSDEDVEKLLMDDVLAAREKAYDYIKRKYGARISLTPNQDGMLIDYVFNMGSLDGFPKMVDAILRGDKEKMAKEYKRYATIGGERKEIAGRNAAFASEFMSEANAVEVA